MCQNCHVLDHKKSALHRNQLLRKTRKVKWLGSGHNEAIAELGPDSRLHKLSGDSQSFQKSPLDGDVSTNIQILAEALLSGF